MSDWTYEPPEPAVFLRHLVQILNRRRKELVPHLARARCAFEVSSTYGSRPHAYTVSIRLSVPDSALDRLEGPVANSFLREAAQLAIPAEAGLDVVAVEVVPLLDADGAPHDDRLGEVLRADYAGVKDAWMKALARRDTDADGALTAARTLLETLLKHMLEDLGETYESGDDLPKLYKAVAKKLNLAPEQHTEETFKRILGGCTSVVEGLGSVRSKAGDAHGHGRRKWKVEPRHAELAVNLAGAMATFLVLTKETRANLVNGPTKTRS